LRDSKRYRWHIDPECCPTRGVRALALLPTNAFGIDTGGLVVNLYDAAEGTIDLRSGTRIGLDLVSNYPFDGKVHLTLRLVEVTTFTLRLRLPGWCKDWSLSVCGKQEYVEPESRGYLVLERTWHDGDEIHFEMDMPVNIVADEIGNSGRVAVIRGPLVFAADNAYLPEGMFLDDILLLLDAVVPPENVQIVKMEDVSSVHLRVPAMLEKPEMSSGWWQEPERYRIVSKGKPSQLSGTIELVPFFEAGNQDDPDNYKDDFWTRHEQVAKITYQVWLPYRLGSQ
jgi:DUF1680 family protein